MNQKKIDLKIKKVTPEKGYKYIKSKYQEGDTISLSDCEYSGLRAEINGLTKERLTKDLLSILNITKSYCDRIHSLEIDLNNEREFSIVFDDYSVAVRFC
jgi:hypothetical protein